MTSKPNCPQCKSKKYVVSIFGSICPECLYEPRQDARTTQSHETHSACVQRLKDFGGNAECCWCEMHEGCELHNTSNTKCCPFCSKETLYDDVGAPNCTNLNCECHAKTTKKVVDARAKTNSVTIPPKKCLCGAWCTISYCKCNCHADATARAYGNHQIEATPEAWERKFDLLWGIAPPDSLKGKKGADIKRFITNLLAKETAKARKEAYGAVLGADAALHHEIGKVEGEQIERDRIKQDLLRIAKAGEMEELRREVERYFAV